MTTGILIFFLMLTWRPMLFHHWFLVRGLYFPACSLTHWSMHKSLLTAYIVADIIPGTKVPADSTLLLKNWYWSSSCCFSAPQSFNSNNYLHFKHTHFNPWPLSVSNQCRQDFYNVFIFLFLLKFPKCIKIIWNCTSKSFDFFPFS